MSPAAIVEKASKQGIDIIGITDHNTTRQAPLIAKLGKKLGLYVMCGAEVTTKEEVHCLAFMPNLESLAAFQSYLDTHLPNIVNDPDAFGYQVQVDESEDICYQEERLLISGINQSVDQVAFEVHKLGGLFIPAHINRPKYSLSSQLGFVPPDLDFDALELSRHITVQEYKKHNKYLNNATFIQSSDAHFIDDVGTVYTELLMEKRSFEEVRMALKSQNGRGVVNT